MKIRFRNRVLLNGVFSDADKERRQFIGALILEKRTFNITGYADYNDDIATNVQLELVPSDNGPPVSLKYHLQRQPTGYAIRSTISKADQDVHLEGHLTTKHTHARHWDLHIKVRSFNMNFVS